jgi:hypothetical protein
VHAAEEECRLTLGQDDVVRGRGVRLASLAEHVDGLGLVLRPQILSLPGAPLDPDGAVFTAELALALAGTAVPLVVELGVASGEVAARGDGDESAIDDVTASPDDARRGVDQMLQRLVNSGVAGLHAAAWRDWGDRLTGAPPADRRPWLARLGIVDSTGVSKPMAVAWDALAGAEQSLGTPSPYPPAIDVEAYYANLPDSLRDLHVSWQGERGGSPAILD